MNRPPASLTDVPDEILLAIAAELFDSTAFDAQVLDGTGDEGVKKSYRDLSALRLVSKRLNLAAAPHLFRWILFDPDQDRASLSSLLTKLAFALSRSSLELARFVQVVQVFKSESSTKNFLGSLLPLLPLLPLLTRLRQIDVPALPLDSLASLPPVNVLETAGAVIVTPDSVHPLTIPWLASLQSLTVRLEWGTARNANRMPNVSPIELQLPQSLTRLHLLRSHHFSVVVTQQTPVPSLQTLEISGTYNDISSMPTVLTTQGPFITSLLLFGEEIESFLQRNPNYLGKAHLWEHPAVQMNIAAFAKTAEIITSPSLSNSQTLTIYDLHLQFVLPLENRTITTIVLRPERNAQEDFKRPFNPVALVVPPLQNWTRRTLPYLATIRFEDGWSWETLLKGVEESDRPDAGFGKDLRAKGLRLLDGKGKEWDEKWEDTFFREIDAMMAREEISED